MKPLVSINENRATTSSLLIAESFDKQHKNILRDIDQLECSAEFRRLNFEPSSYFNAQNKMMPLFNITRDGFVWLAMGFTGKKAAEFKERFITAFNQMEQALTEGQGERKKIDIEHNRTRRLDNPNGIDIKYTLDLTKIVMHPTRSGLEVLEKLTGLNMEDIELNTLQEGVRINDISIFSAFLATRCAPCSTEDRTLLKEIYATFIKWNKEANSTPCTPLPSRKKLSSFLRVQGYNVPSAKTTGGLTYVYGLCIRPESNG